MSKTQQIWLYCLLGLISFFAPLLLVMEYAQQQGRDNAIAQLTTLNQNAFRTSKATWQQVEQVFTALEQQSEPPCSAQQLHRMRTLTTSLHYLQGVGYIQDNHLLCSSMGVEEQAIALGKPDKFDDNGAVYWSAVKLPELPDKHFNISARNGYAAIIAPDLVLDTVPDTDDISLTQVSTDTGQVMRQRGAYKKHWVNEKITHPTVLNDPDYLVVMQPAWSPHSLLIAAMPQSKVQQLSRESVHQALPMGLISGLLLSLLVYILARYQLSMKSQLVKALKKREFFLLYQPVIDLNSGHCVGAEALIRWRKPNGELISPDRFIPVAEKNGLIEQITEHVMQIVAQDARDLIREHPKTHIAINFSPEDLQSDSLEARLQELIQKTGGTAHNILIEATERGFMNPKKAKGALIRMRAQGFKVAIDDFGTGNSSLSYLATYDLDYLKIDKMFVSELGHDTASSRVALHIIEMARTLNLQMIAEGVETQEQSRILREAGVQFAQGWIFGKPMPMAKLTELILQRNTPPGP